MADTYQVRYRRIETGAQLPAIKEHVVMIHDVMGVRRSPTGAVVFFNDAGDVIRSFEAHEFINVRKIPRLFIK